MLQNLSSAAVVIGALRVKTCFHLSFESVQSELSAKFENQASDVGKT